MEAQVSVPVRPDRANRDHPVFAIYSAELYNESQHDESLDVHELYDVKVNVTLDASQHGHRFQ